MPLHSILQYQLSKMEDFLAHLIWSKPIPYLLRNSLNLILLKKQIEYQATTDTLMNLISLLKNH